METTKLFLNSLFVSRAFRKEINYLIFYVDFFLRASPFLVIFILLACRARQMQGSLLSIEIRMSPIIIQILC